MLNYQRGVVSKTQIPNDTYFCGWNSNQMWTAPWGSLRISLRSLHHLLLRCWRGGGAVTCCWYGPLGTKLTCTSTQSGSPHIMLWPVTTTPFCAEERFTFHQYILLWTSAKAVCPLFFLPKFEGNEGRTLLASSLVRGHNLGSLGSAGQDLQSSKSHQHVLPSAIFHWMGS